MAEDNPKYNARFEAQAEGFAVGDHNIIYNYFGYREEVKVEPDDDNLPCPYRGLYHFNPNDAEYFFGREVFVEELFKATQTRNFIPVLGASGSGKSSVVLAGLVPKLEQEGHWKFTHFRPGSDPFHALALALVPLYTPELDDTDKIAQARKLASYLNDNTVVLSDVFTKIQQNHSNHRLLLIADQFEELYTLCEEKSRHRFLDILLDSIHSPLSQTNSLVLVTMMRADFLGNALSYPTFADLLRTADVKIRSMNREELCSVIEKPAQKLGVTFEAGLVERILDDVEDEPGNLPLLEFALTELWNKRTSKQLTHKIYEEIGQVEGALARHADEKYGNLTKEEQDQVRRIFLQLVRPGEGAEDTRRIAMKTELGEQSWSLVKQLADARLVVTSRNSTEQETVEIVHEALIHNWGELRQWMNTDRVFRAWQEQLRSAKRQWEATNQDPGSLLRGAALAEAEENLTERPEDLISEKVFIEESIQERDRLEREKEELRKHELRQTLRNVFGTTASLIITLVAVFAGFKWREEQIVQINLLNATSPLLLRSNKEVDDLKAIKQALQTEKKLKQMFLPDAKLRAQAKATLHKVVYGVRERNRLEEHKDDIIGLGISTDGSKIASVDSSGIICLWDNSGKLLAKFQGSQGNIHSVSFNPDVSLLATIDSLTNPDGSFPGDPNKRVFTLRLWNLKTQKQDIELRKPGGWAREVAFSKDGKQLATWGYDRDRNRVENWWNLSGQPIPQNQFKGEPQFSMPKKLRSTDGKIATAQEDKVSLKDSSGQEIAQIETNHDFISSWVFSPDGKQLVTTGDRNVSLWDLSSKHLAKFKDHRSTFKMIFSPDGSLLASSDTSYENEDVDPVRFPMGIGRDNAISLWNLQGRKLGEVPRNQGNRSPLNFMISPDNQRLAIAEADGTARLWDWKNRQQIAEFQEPLGSSLVGVSFSGERSLIVTKSGNSTVQLWNWEGKQLAQFQDTQSQVYQVILSPDGSKIVTAGNDGFRLWNLDGKQVAKFKATLEKSERIILSRDGSSVAINGKDGVRVWDWEGKQVAQFNFIEGASFSSDGRLLTGTSGYSGTTRVWDLKSQQLVAEFNGNGVFDVQFSPDGKLLVIVGNDGSPTLWRFESLDELMVKGCNWARDYLENNPNVNESDRHLCDGIDLSE
ncbi:MAG: WD40 repeat domain-containing protein [Xenococcus sp. MO_188.B8]|nr:WD40 repeat domain-containing protein [Xenococcus sp. MO_188.B8]